jgi:hypothetical protein
VDVFAVPVMVVMMVVFVPHRFVHQLQHRPAAAAIRLSATVRGCMAAACR